jgi:hypothetical protein
VSNGFLGDAEVALQNVIKWDKNDKQCYEALVQVQEALWKAKGKSAQSSSFSLDQVCGFGLFHCILILCQHLGLCKWMIL